MTWPRKCGYWLRSTGILLLLFLGLSSPLYSDTAPEDMTTAEIVAELTSIISEQETRLNEAESLLTEQRSTLLRLRQELNELQESYTRLNQAIDAQRNYSKSLEVELSRLRRQRVVLLTISGISIVTAVIGWIL